MELPPQLLVWLKSDGFAPVAAMPVTVRLPEPVFVTVTDCVDVDPTPVVGKLMEFVDNETNGAVGLVPVSAIDCGLPLALSLICIVAENDPPPAGLKLI